MYDWITPERIATEDELFRYKMALHVRDITDNGRAIVNCCVGIMEREDPEITLDLRLAAARQLIEIGEFIPTAAEHIQAAETIIAESADPQ